MARATRSTAHDNLKKRKRVSLNNDDDDDAQHPASKLSRHDDPADNDNTSILPEHASAILDILEMSDTQGLLDRVFPVHSHPGASSSLRALLRANHSLRVLRAAVQHLFPISSLPRSKPSSTAAQQHRFCTLAVSLLDQASQHTTPVPLSLSSLLPDQSETASHPPRALKYALVQHLPNADYWTSLNTDTDLSDALKTLPTAHAELVAILPTPASTSTKPAPTLGSYNSTRTLTTIKPPAQRKVPAGTFLDYGVWSSFAPSFDHNAEVVGRRELGQVLYARHERRQANLALLREAREGMGSIERVASPEPHKKVDVNAELEELLPPEEVALIKAALTSLELENAVQELLERNQRALVRLEELQIERLVTQGENSKAEEESEEWDTAQGIIDSLAVLASLRPRASSSSDKTPSTIIPPPSVLHKLHRTLAVEPSPGWYGTLPPTRSTALRDDTTVKKSRSAAVPVTTPTTAPVPVSTIAATTATTATAPVPVTVTQPVAIPYSGYTYAYGAQQPQQAYRAQTGTPTHGQTTQYPYAAAAAQYYYPQQQQQQAQVVGQAGQSYYGQQQQGYGATAYSWYSTAPYGVQPQQPPPQQQPQQQQQGGVASGRGTPQPGTQQQQQQPTYGSFFGAARGPAVANTVYAPAAVGTPTGAGGVGALPVHLRGAQQGQQGQQGGYYGAYQQQQQQQASPAVGR